MAYSRETATKMQKLNSQAAQFEKQVRAKLNKMVRAGSRYNGGGGASDASHRARYSEWMSRNAGMYRSLTEAQEAFNRENGFRLKAGQHVNDKQVRDYINQVLGGNPYARKMEEMKSAVASGTSDRNVARVANQAIQEADQEASLMDRLFESFQEKTDEANAANESRYGEAKGLLEELRTRNQDRVDSFGRSAQADIEERVAENLGDVRAELAGRGLANSNILPAFMMRAERDKMREINRINEARDARAADYDSRDTGNIARLIESRNDIAPDYSMLANLALQYGQSGANESESLRDELQQLREQMATQSQQGQQQIVPRRTSGGIYSPGTPIVGNYGPLNMAQNFLGNVNQQIGYGNWRRNSSDMYPTNRHYVPPEQRVNRTDTQAASPSLTVDWLDTMARTA